MNTERIDVLRSTYTAKVAQAINSDVGYVDLDSLEVLEHIFELLEMVTSLSLLLRIRGLQITRQQVKLRGFLDLVKDHALHKFPEAFELYNDH